MGPLWEVRQVWAGPRDWQRTLLLSGRRGAVAAMSPGRKQGQPSRRNAMPARPVALLSNLAPTNLSGYKIQSDSHGHKAASRHQRAAGQTASRLLSTASAASTAPGSPSRISCTPGMCYMGTGAGGTRFFSPQSRISMAGASADLGPRASGKPENSST